MKALRTKVSLFSVLLKVLRSINVNKCKVRKKYELEKKKKKKKKERNRFNREKKAVMIKNKTDTNLYALFRTTLISSSLFDILNHLMKNLQQQIKKNY